MKATHFSRGNIIVWLGFAITLIGALTYFIQHTPLMAEFDARQPGLYITLVGIALSALGFVIENWNEDMVWRKSLGLKILPISIVLIALYVGNTFFAYRQEEVQITNGDVVLAGTLLIPNGEAPHPAVVMMHGAGPSTRMGNFAEAQSLARDGIAALIYDKRGSGETVGGHHRFDGYDALASDGVAAINFLRSHDDIDPSQVGLWGTSEGGWTAPMAASKSPDLAFLIIISGGPISLEEQGLHSLENKNLHGFSEEAISQARELYQQYYAYIRNGLNRDELHKAIQRVQNEDWFDAAGIDTTVHDYDELSEYEVWLRDHLDMDVAPLLEQMEFPIMFALGANDWKVPSLLVKERVERILGDTGHQDYVVEIFPEATHNIVTAPTGCRICLPDTITGLGAPSLPWFAPGYLDAVSEWVTQRVETAG